METRAPHVVIGAFVLVFVAGILGLVIWLAKLEIDSEYDRYRIAFEGAVSGLSVGGDVRFNGILVGRVMSIRIDPDSLQHVEVVIEVQGDTPVRIDTVASLELQGITGVSYVQLSGGSPSAPMLEPGPDGGIPEIESTPSAIQQLFAGAPELINRVIYLVNEFTLLVNERNRGNIAAVLENLATVSGSVAGRAPEIDRILVNFDRSSEQVRDTLDQVNLLVRRLNAVADSTEATLGVARGALTTLDATMENDVRLLIGDLRRVSGNLETVTGELATALSNNEEAVDVFLGQGLVDFTRFVQEARQLVARGTTLVEDLQNNPTRFLFGQPAGGVEAP